MREPRIVCVSNNAVLCCRSSAADSANTHRKRRKKADPSLSGIGFASSDEENSIVRGTRGDVSARLAQLEATARR